jgi:putative GTP pyrophosphokinase
MASLESEYLKRYDAVLLPCAAALEGLLRDQLSGVVRLDRISCRAKSPERFLAKSKKKDERGVKYDDPLLQIQDQIGARIIVFYLSDVLTARTEVERYHRHIERKFLEPESENAFGYVGFHYIAALPTDAIPKGVDRDLVPEFFELQVKTLWQHAWAEANHDLGYKPEAPLTAEQKRKLAFTAAQGWGADRIFEELLQETSGKRILTPMN